ncbi:MAG: cbb3-type cytochrome c oxidase subunit II [Leucothrix sp.]
MQRILAVMGGALGVLLFALLLIVAGSHLQDWQATASPGVRDYTPQEQHGRDLYVSLGCVYCHTQQVRGKGYPDVERGWGKRPSAPGDYVFDRPHLLGTMRTGPDLHNVASRLPSDIWHFIHLYQPDALVPGSIMPPHRFLFDVVDKTDTPSDKRVIGTPPGLIPQGKALLASKDAEALVAYLLTLSHE